MAALNGGDSWGDVAMWIAGRVGNVFGASIAALFSSAFSTTVYAPELGSLGGYGGGDYYGSCIPE